MQKQLIDQGAHFLAAFAVVCLVSLAGASMVPPAGLLIGGALGLNREFGQHDTLDMRDLGLGSLLDLAFWCIGGLAGGIVAYAYL